MNNWKMSDAVIVVPFSRKNVLLRLVRMDEFDKWDKILCRIGASRNNSSDDPGWLLPKDKIDLFEDVLYKGSKRSRIRVPREADPDDRPRSVHKGSRFRSKKTPNTPDDDSSATNIHRKDSYNSPQSRDSPDARRHSSRDDDEGEESSDDELIQTVLARRLMSESSHKSIEDEEISNSDNEDCVSYARRIRHIYTVLKQQRTEIAMLREALRPQV